MYANCIRMYVQTLLKTATRMASGTLIIQGFLSGDLETAAALVTTATALAAIYKWTALLGQTLMPALNALLLGSLLYRSRLVPRILPTLGLVGAPILIASVIVGLFCIDHPITVLAGVGTLPIAVWEFSLGVWLTFKGFKPSAVAGLPAVTTAPSAPIAVAA